MVRTDGGGAPGALTKRLIRLRLSLRRAFGVRVALDDRGHRSVFVCETWHDVSRVASLWVKEPGTMAWIDAEVRPGDVFHDIGANIGIYAIAAAHRVGADGRVVAFEPHKVNATALLRNVTESGLADRVEVVATAVSDRSGLARFHYKSLKSASTASQLGHTRRAGGEGEFDPVVTELVPAVVIDELVAAGRIPPPSLVKIDVDGNELEILRGMEKVLTGADRPRAVQVELNPGEEPAVTAFMSGCGYALAERHFTKHGRKMLDAGRTREEIAHNAIFRPAP